MKVELENSLDPVFLYLLEEKIEPKLVLLVRDLRDLGGESLLHAQTTHGGCSSSSPASASNSPELPKAGRGGGNYVSYDMVLAEATFV